MRSRILDVKFKLEMRRLLDRSSWGTECFLGRDVTVADLKLSGYVPSVSERLMIVVMG
jgi:hypothetical protein